MNTVNGALDLRFPEKVNAEIKASSVNGSMRSDFPILVRNHFLSHKMNGTIGQGGVVINLETVNGSIELSRLK